ncbi:hypothetical protein F5Y13DRAFT_193282 [Hypoxylon sp. FL1857]|nr:hypothetical protein F5Y13DRAFT_193282 [Hypoxylon sp. FL1857]
MPLTLLDLIGQYPILTTLASYLSTLDLFHLGLTCRDYHAHILSSAKVFEVLQRDCLCDGHGLRRRLNTRHYHNFRYVWPSGRSFHGEEEMEVRLFAAKCDEAGALPCVKCGINICEECRHYPRVLDGPHSPNPRPHLDGSQNANLMCLCDSCDARLEEQLRGQFLNELCDCNVYRRWICPTCVKKENRWMLEYYKKHTVREVQDYSRYVEDYDSTKVMGDDQFDILFYCPCGAFVPKEARPRCTWCKRKHRPESEWGDESREVRSVPVDDGSYPLYSGTVSSYPTLAYNGPIYQGPFRNDDSS